MPLERESIGTVKVHVEHQFGFIGLEEGWAVPPSFLVIAQMEEVETPTTIEIKVVVEKGARPRAARVSVELEDGSVSSTTLRQVPIRELVATGLLKAVAKVQTTPAGGYKITPTKESDFDEVLAVVKRAVGWLS